MSSGTITLTRIADEGSGTPWSSAAVIAPMPAPTSAFCINSKSWIFVIPSRLRSPWLRVYMSPIKKPLTNRLSIQPLMNAVLSA